jgi:hypothetical protein
MIRAPAAALLPILILAVACAPQAHKRRGPPPIPAYAKPWRFSQTGGQATLAYGDGGPVLMTCAEGGDWVTIVAPGGAAQERNRRVTLVAGTGTQRVEMAVAFNRWDNKASVVWTRSLSVRDLLIDTFRRSKSLRIDARDFPSNRSPESDNAAWRFLATCEQAPRDSAATGAPTAASFHALMTNLDPANAAADARAALAHGDRRLVGVDNGYGQDTPGFDSRVSWQGGSRLVDPTHMLFSEEHLALKIKVRAYAEAYNAVIVAAR